MPTTLAFDVYGTLVDTNGVVTLLEKLVGDHADGFAQRWRDRQLEYSFRRALMQRYQEFSVCVAQSLDHTCASMDINLSSEQKESLLQFFRKLPAFADVEPALKSLQEKDIRMYAFSNGRTDAVEGLLEGAGLREYFKGVVSVDDIRSFKPDPAVYQHFLKRADSKPEHTWLISGNPFDVIGARSAGLNAAWVRRSPKAVFDPWEFEPNRVVNSLTELISIFE